MLFKFRSPIAGEQKVWINDPNYGEPVRLL